MSGVAQKEHEAWASTAAGPSRTYKDELERFEREVRAAGLA
jgi:hypothetical protein